MSPHALVRLCASLSLVACADGDGSLTCGPGTVAASGRCVVAPDSSDADTSDTDTSDTPRLLGFVASQGLIVAGSSTTLTAWFTGGEGVVSGGVGPVMSGVPVVVSPTATTTYTLTVRGHGGELSADLTVEVAAPASLTLILGGDAPPSAAVEVWGPGGQIATLSETQTLGGLAAGSYVVLAREVVSGGKRHVAQPGVETVELSAGQTVTLELVYHAQSGPPFIAPVADQVHFPTDAPRMLTLTVADTEDPADALELSASSSTPDVVALALSGTGSVRTLSLTPTAPGRTIVTLAVTDLSGLESRTEFEVAVIAAVVTSAADSGVGSLREVLAASTDGRPVGFSPALEGPIALSSGPIVIPEGSVVLRGPGARALALRSVANNVFVVSAGARLDVSGLTFRDSQVAIRVLQRGQLRVADSAFVDNAACVGGALYIEGEASMYRSLVADNFTSCFSDDGGAVGGAVTVASEGSVFAVFDSTFAGNNGLMLAGGAAIASLGGMVILTGCTVTDNGCVLEDCDQKSVAVLDGALFLRRTIIAGNRFTPNRQIGGDLAGYATTPRPVLWSLGGNVLGDVKGDLALAEGDLVGVKDPGLSALADHGGATDTAPPLPGSPALGRAPLGAFGQVVTSQAVLDAPGFDQRGDLRRALRLGPSDAGAVDRREDDPDE